MVIICMHTRLHLFKDTLQTEQGGHQGVKANKQPLSSNHTAYILFRDDLWSEIKKHLFFTDTVPVWANDG